MLDRITSVDITGGSYGLGYIVAEKDLHPDDWYFPCHFRDDEVLAGSLQAEGGGNLLRFFMMMLGLQPFVQVANHKTVWKYRGQILLNVKEMHLEVHVKTVEMKGSQLVMVADAFLWNDNMRIYQVTDIALGIEEAE
ncbi:UNVERIFIED_CONTAM: hypothetical protein GTU68_026159 [Idotea baltica]|nr:hypothetical protein [Idotea baltica]